MDAFPALNNVDEFVSDYFFTSTEKKQTFTKAVSDRIKEWKSEEHHPLARFQSLQQSLIDAYATGRDHGVDEARQLMRSIVGIADNKPAVTYKAETVSGVIEIPAWVVPNVVVVEAEAYDFDTVVESVTDFSLVHTPVVDGKPQPEMSLSKLIGELFIADPVIDDETREAYRIDGSPEFIVVISGRYVLLAQRESWHLGRYLIIDVITAIERGDKKSAGEIERVVCSIALENVVQQADGTSWWGSVIQTSIEHTVSVSASLRGAIRQSIEVLGNDVLARRRKQGLEPYPELGMDLTHQSLRYLYRILFLLFAEASPELEILPVGHEDYERGYGLGRLRNHLLTTPQTPAEYDGTYLYESLQVLFRLVGEGFTPKDKEAGLRFENIEADLFSPQQTSLIDEVQLSNGAMIKILEHLLLTPESKGKDRGFISYATLGVTELGQVYEGLMSFKGFIADEPLYEIAPHGDRSKGSWVIPVEKVRQDPNSYPDEHFLTDINPTTGERRRVVYDRGDFVYRQSARDRERSASFYTPPVISSFVVSQAIEQLEENGVLENAEDILNLKILEPALGSGAFGVEAIRQLASKYLTMRQEELGVQIPAEDYTAELQKVKAYLAIHAMHGVDLNPTAVELAEISLWLDSMTAGLRAPWFGLHLRTGNSLVGALRATYTPTQVKEKAYLKEPAKRVYDHGASGSVEREHRAPEGHVYQFLLPSSVWAAATQEKQVEQWAPGIKAEFRPFVNEWKKKLTASQLKLAQELTRQIDRLWEIATLRLTLAEAQAARSVEVFGHEPVDNGYSVSRQEIEAHMQSPSTAIARLRLVMNAWCGLMFWPISEEKRTVDGEVVHPPSTQEWLDALAAIVGREASKAKQDDSLATVASWSDLDRFEAVWLGLQGAQSVERLHREYPWLTVTNEVAERHNCFHWDVEFGAVFADGGFDLIVGNPPWVRPRTDEEAILAEYDPWWSIAHKPTQTAKKQRIESATYEAIHALADGVAEDKSTAAILGDASQYPALKRQQPDLYRAFMQRVWGLHQPLGVAALVHPETHFTDAKGESIRSETYPRLRRHFQFINELRLYDIAHMFEYGIHVYGKSLEEISFVNIQGLYHPRTAAESLKHDGKGEVPGRKNAEGHWDLRPHRERVQVVDIETLKIWNALTGEPSTTSIEAKLGKVPIRKDLRVLESLVTQPRVGTLSLEYSPGWHESADRKKGLFEHGWNIPEGYKQVILQGPHLGLSTPFSKQPNPSLKNHKDWFPIDLEAMPAEFVPATAYRPVVSIDEYRDNYTFWETETGEKNSALDFYRVAWRRQANCVGFRTLYPAIVPPGSAHVHPVFTAASPNSLRDLLRLAAGMSSILNDFLVRCVVGGDIFPATLEKLPLCSDERLSALAARLHCVNAAYAPLWEEVMGEPWTVDSPARKALDRYWLQVEIDVIVAHSFGVSADQLCHIYNTQFNVMAKYDRTEPYDVHGRKVPKEVLKEAEKSPEKESFNWVHPQSGVEYIFVKPFECRDREADMREMYERIATSS